MAVHVRWSKSPDTHDLSDRRDRISVHEQVLTQATEDDVRFFINIDQLGEALSRAGPFPTGTGRLGGVTPEQKAPLSGELPAQKAEPALIVRRHGHRDQ